MDPPACGVIRTRLSENDLFKVENKNSLLVEEITKDEKEEKKNEDSFFGLCGNLGPQIKKTDHYNPKYFFIFYLIPIIIFLKRRKKII